MSSLEHHNKYSMQNLRRLRLSTPNANRTHEFDSMQSFRNWLSTSAHKTDWEKISFSIWDKTGHVKTLDDVNISSLGAMCNSINREWLIGGYGKDIH